MGSNERIFRHLNSTFGSSRIASSAYQKWPTKSSDSTSKFKLSNMDCLPVQMALPDKTHMNSCYPEGNFGGNQLLDDSISLSLVPQVFDDPLYVRTASDLSFCRLHPTQA
ncbi:hypothetical protein PCE1_003125 [Barthelona sp. PCE]